MKLFTRPQKSQLQTNDIDIQENYFDEISEEPDELLAVAKDLELPPALASQPIAPTPVIAQASDVAIEEPVSQPEVQARSYGPLSIHAKAVHGPRQILPAESREETSPAVAVVVAEAHAPVSTVEQDRPTAVVSELPPQPQIPVALNAEVLPPQSEPVMALESEILDLSAYHPEPVAEAASGMELPFSPHVLDLSS